MFISQKNICEKIKNGDFKTQLEYIYKYTEENHKEKFIIWTIRRNGTKEDAEDIFQDSVIDIYIAVKEGKIVISCNGISFDCDNFLAYFNKILQNKLFTQIKKTDRLTSFEFSNTNAFVKNDNVEIEINSDDRICFVKYLYYEELSSNDKKHYEWFFIKELRHEQVVELDDGIDSITSSKSTKHRLVRKLYQRWKSLKNNIQLLEYIRYNYGG